MVPWGSGLDVHYVTPGLLGMAMPRAKITTTGMTGGVDLLGPSRDQKNQGQPPQSDKDQRIGEGGIVGNTTCSSTAAGTGTADAADSSNRPRPLHEAGRASDTATIGIEDDDIKTPARSNTSRLISSENTARVPAPPMVVTDDDGADIGSSNTKSPQRTPHRSLASSRASSRGASRTPSRNGSYDQLHAMAQGMEMEMGSPARSVGRRRRRRPGMSPLGPAGAGGAGDVDGGGVRFATEQQQQRRLQQLEQDPRLLDIQRSQSLSQMQYQNNKQGSSKDSAASGGAQQPSQNAGGMPPNGPTTAKLQGNCPAALSTFLKNRHPDRFLCFNLTGSPADERTVLLLNHQVVNCPWTAMDVAEAERRSRDRAENRDEDENEDDSTSVDTSGTTTSSGGSRSPSTPSLPALLDICYAIAAYHALSPQNVACVYCQNGKTRTGVAIACYLKFSGRVQSSLDGFRLFCRQCNMGSGDTIPRRQQPLERILTPNRAASAAAVGGGASSRHANRSKQDVASLIPPSLLQLFHNFDDLIELRAWPNPQSLRLRAITLTGVPVDDLPVVEIWDGATGRVYSSHDSNTATNDDDGVADDSSKTRLFGEPAQWTDEEGFYLIDKPLRSEFTILCRFGGTVADDAYDPTKILFRYINHTAFLTWGAYQLSRDRVDIMRRYLGSFEDDFLVVLLFEPSKLARRSAVRLPPVLSGLAALRRGFILINDHHSVQSPLKILRVLEKGPPAWASGLATKLANRDSNRRDDILASPQFVGLLSAITVDEISRANLHRPTPPPTKSLQPSIIDGKDTKTKMKTESEKDTCEDANIDETESSKSSKGNDPSAALLSATQSKGSLECKGEEAPQPLKPDPRSALLGAIRDRGINPDKDKSYKGDTPPDPRAALIKGSDSEDTKRSESSSAAGVPAKDPHSAVLGTVRARGPMSENPKDKAGATQLPADPREAETAKEDTASGNKSANPLSALFGAIRARGGSNDKEKNEHAIESPTDPRGAVLASIRAHGAQVEGSNRSVQQEGDARSALLDAIQSRGQNTDNNKDGVDGSEPAVDLGAIRAAGTISEEEKEAGGDNDDTKDNRNSLLDVITTKGSPHEDKNDAKPDNQSGGGSGQTGAAMTTAYGAAGGSIPKLDATSSLFLTLLDSMEFAGSDRISIPIDESSTHDDALAAYGHQLLCSDACLVEPLFAPRPGDVVDAFGPPIDLKNDASETRTNDADDDARTRPRLPLHEWKERHRQQSALHSAEIDDGGNPLSSLRDVVTSGFVESGLLPFTLASTPRRTSASVSAAADSLQYLWDPVASHFQDRDDIGACMALLSKMPRSGLRVEDLLHLLVESQMWSDSELLRMRQATSQYMMLPNQAVVADASLTREGAAANVAAAISNNIQLKTGPMGGPNSATASKGALAAAGAISQRNDSVTDLAKGIEAGPELKRNGSSTGAADAAAAIAASQVKKQDENDGLALKDDPEWSK